MVAAMRIRSDPANGATHNPTHRSPVWDFVPKHNPHHICAPQYVSEYLDWDPITNPHGEPVSYFHAHREHYAYCDKCPRVVNTAPYQPQCGY
jgi:hypothetical protein